MKDCDLLLIGHLSRDIIVDQGREERSTGVAESLRYAAALTSLKMEAPGAFRGTVEAVLRRMEADRPPGVDP
jgi:hypothetical protein